MSEQFKPGEDVLPDGFPVYVGYAYLADGKVIINDVQGTVRLLKRDVGASEIRRCDLVERGIY